MLRRDTRACRPATSQHAMRGLNPHTRGAASRLFLAIASHPSTNGLHTQQTGLSSTAHRLVSKTQAVAWSPVCQVIQCLLPPTFPHGAYLLHSQWHRQSFV
ncbi:hypothetical protein IQ07DRAFT_433100 [Pyrenochaeta sp. DS3sAY3a]|nr:hypothetical protein IQ07DRAFT_433100 [Pyrenochaeta sp. DS3sAY3a]